MISPSEEWIPEHQFGFRQGYLIIQQTHRITRNNSRYRTKNTMFTNVRQAFDKIWHVGLLYKIAQIIPSSLQGSVLGPMCYSQLIY